MLECLILDLKKVKKHQKSKKGIKAAKHRGVVSGDSGESWDSGHRAPLSLIRGFIAFLCLMDPDYDSLKKNI